MQSNRCLKRAGLLVAVVVAAACAGNVLRAQDVVKANNTDSLNLGSSWVGGTAPTSSNVAVWNNTISTTGTVTTNVTANLSLQGIKVTNPAAVIGIGSTSINTGSVTANSATDTFTFTGTDPVNGNIVTFSHTAGSVPTGITASRQYVIVNVDSSAKTYQVANAVNGTPVNFTTNGANVSNNILPALSLGSGGIDLSSATQNLGLVTAPVLLSDHQTWKAAASRGIDINNNGNNTGISVINNGYTLTVDGAGSVDLGNYIGTGGLVKNGTGALRLFGGNSSFSGDVELNAGTLNIGNNTTTVGTGSLIVNGGTLTAIAATAMNFGRNVTVGGNASFHNNNSNNTAAQSYTFGTLSIGAHTFSVTANGSGTGTLTFGSTTLTGGATFNVGSRSTNFVVFGAVGQFGGSNGLTKSGVGTMNITGASTYTGTTAISGGVLALTGSGSLSSSSPIVNDATLDISAITSASTSIGRLGGSGSVLIGSKTLTFGGSGDASFSGTITGSTGAITKQGNGFQTLSGSNTYDGMTTISQGGLVIASTSALPGWSAAGRFSVASGATLAVGNAVADADVVALLGTGNFAASSRIGFDTAGGSRTYAAGLADTVSGALGLTKLGDGTLTLSGSSTYSGSTAVNAGKLVVNGALANTSGMTVADGASLGGSGVINGLTTVDGTLTPGNSPGILTFDSLLLGSSASTIIEIESAGVRGTAYDGITVLDADGLTYGGSMTFAFGSIALADNTLFDIFEFVGTPSGNFTTLTSTGFYDGTWSNVGGGQWQSSKGGQTLTFSQSTGQLVIVPEPATIIFAGIGIAMTGWSLWKRRRIARLTP